MNEALRGYRETLLKELKGYESTLEAMKEGREKVTSRCAVTGQMVDVTDARIESYAGIIRTLGSVIDNMSIKLGDRR